MKILQVKIPQRERYQELAATAIERLGGIDLNHEGDGPDDDQWLPEEEIEASVGSRLKAGYKRVKKAGAKLKAGAAKVHRAGQRVSGAASRAHGFAQWALR